MCIIFLNAVKETHPAGSDRNTVSPTESAVCERLGTGTLRSRLPELYDCGIGIMQRADRQHLT